MEHMTLNNIAKACHGRLLGGEDIITEIEGVAIDSRKVLPGFLFIAIKGERVDGHSFVKDVYEKGALCCVVEKQPEEVQHPYILVESTLQAIKDIAMFYRQSLSIKVVGITGSVGKTSTKEMIASVLSQKYNVLKTEGNFNNEIGLPLTIFNLRKEHEIAVLEMGISDFEEMHRLSRIARPDLCVITNIGLCHLENLKSREGILKAKTEMFDYMQPDGKVCLNGDDDMLITVKEVAGKKPVFFGLQKSNEVYADNIQNLGLEGMTCEIHMASETYPVSIPVAGEHMVYNALAAAGVGHLLGLTKQEIAAGIEQMQTVKGRNHLIKTEKLQILDDCYNANPVSMKAAIDIVSRTEGRKVAILGDMYELGEGSVQFHKEVGKYAVESNIDCILCVGEDSKYMYDTATEIAVEMKSDSQILYYENKQDLIKALPEILQEKDTVLVKASHGMHFEEVVSALTENF